jgi:adenosylhomocysteinase
MPVLLGIRERFAKERPLKGMRLSVCLHITAKTAALVRTLAAGGAEVMLVASNPLSTQDDVAASLVADDEIPVYGMRGESLDTFRRHVAIALDAKPHLLCDDGADLTSALLQRGLNPGLMPLGATEETTAGVKRFNAMEAQGSIALPRHRRQRKPHQAHV